MDDEQERALSALGFNWALNADDVWDDSPFHVAGLHRQAERFLTRGIADATSRKSNPIGVVVEGQGGSGKTHLLGWIRREIQLQDGYFFLVDFSTGTDFWSHTARQIRSGLQQPRAGTGRSQLGILLRHLSLMADLSAPITEAISGGVPVGRPDLRSFQFAIQSIDRDVALHCRETLRALILYASNDLDLQVLGDNYLASREPVDHREEQQRIEWQLDPVPPAPKTVVEQLSRIVSLSGPSVIAVDQIDALIDAALSSTEEAASGEPGTEPGDDGGGGSAHMSLADLAGGLMDLRQMTKRTLCIISCIPTSWRAIQTRAVSTVRDRYRRSLVLGTISDANTARCLVEKRFTYFYETAGFTPPHPTWPVAASAFATAIDRTPRALLQAINQHVDSCLDRERVDELVDFALVPDDPDPPPPPPPGMEILDHRFRKLVGQYDSSRALDPATEDTEIPRLLSGGLFAWITEQGDGNRFKFDAREGHRPDLHARLRQILDPETERQVQWSFRAIAHAHHRAFQTRLRNAIDSSGLGTPGRSLVILRTSDWPRGTKTASMVAGFEQKGGRHVRPIHDDLACFHALRQMMVEADPSFPAWLQSRRPASNTSLLSDLPPHQGTAPPRRQH